MVGRGLRLPYGERTGDKDVDAVMLTAHDKFKEILEEAQKGDSIFKAGNVIKAKELQPEQTAYTQITLDVGTGDDEKQAYEHTGVSMSTEMDAIFQKAHTLIAQEVST